MSLTIIFLIRHGEYHRTVDGQGRVLTPTPHTGISQIGRKQIAALAREIQKRGDTISAFYTSPYQRTKDSAVLLQSLLGTPRLIIEQELRDVYTPGWWGVPIEDLKDIGGDVYRVSPQTTVQEPYDAMAVRFWGALRSIVKKEQGHTVGLVFHGDPIRVLLYRLEHPADTVPAMRVLSQSDYLDKGEAWRLVIDSNFTIKEKERIGRSEQEFGKGERTY